MNFWTVIVILAAIGAFYSLKRNGYLADRRSRREGWQAEDHAPSAREIELERELQDLRERVKVLERIATDDREARSIAQEIENLRDK